jgi:hypothetical protein
MLYLPGNFRRNFYRNFQRRYFFAENFLAVNHAVGDKSGGPLFWRFFLENSGKWTV